MNWIKITITTNNIEETCAELSALGYDQVEIDDPDELDDFINHQKPFWQLVDDELLQKRERSVSVYAAEDADLSVFEAFEHTRTVIRDCDWMDNWKQYYKPISIGNRLLIQPEWEQLDNPDNRAVFFCDPGVSFGTGTHATTYMCLEYLDELVKQGDTVIDLGCGSGILAVSAMLLGAERAQALDIDVQATDTAKRNAVRNSVALEVEQANLLEDRELWKRLEKTPADIVCANLVADLITAMAADMKRILKPGGYLLISGILEENAEAVLKVMEKAGFVVKNKKTSGGWSSAQLGIDI